ncbi:MAG: divergent polysaccharide deacetylase family protein [Acidobacteriia bacterium]|nr:divergent polysaccharide deacetylase family protein [Methyloceanibacter sp.]MCL6490845.1 divergent polysaccharide deacetylase family protein [Terriglobia bacterium]
MTTPMTEAPRQPYAPRRFSRAARALGVFWGVILVGFVLLALTLEILGPPGNSTKPMPLQAGKPSASSVSPATQAARLASGANPLSSPPQKPGHGQPPAARQEAPSSGSSPAAAKGPPTPAGGEQTGPSLPTPIPPPDLSLLEPASFSPSAQLPKIGADGRLPMRVYAGKFDPNETRPKVALIIAGIGLSVTESNDAIVSTPPAVTLAFSPYAVQPEKLLNEARSHGHEFLISIPMEPQGYPLNDEGPEALLTGADPALNHQRLEWALSRIAGYAGATGALDGMRGERYAAVGPLLLALEDELASRGLYYVDPRPGQPPPAHVSGCTVDIVVDEPGVGSEIEAKLAQLERLAKARGTAVGLAGLPRPVTVEKIAAWTKTLSERGVILVPVSALVQNPPGTLSQNKNHE